MNVGKVSTHKGHLTKTKDHILIRKSSSVTSVIRPLIAKVDFGVTKRFTKSETNGSLQDIINQ